MSREAQIPLLLWISTAILAHMAGGRGAEQVAQVVEDRAEIRSLVEAVREGLRPHNNPLEVDIELPPTPAPEVKEETPDDDEDEEDDESKKDEPKPDDEAIAPPKPRKITPPKPKPLVVKLPPPPPPPAVPEKRIAVRQHVKPDQPDNPNASRIGDQANRVEEETVARLRSHDQDHEKPNPGEQKKPASTGEGNDDREDVAQSEDKPGTRNAPGESAQRSESAEHHQPVKPPSDPVARAAPPQTAPGQGGSPGRDSAASSSSPGQTRGSVGGGGPASPEVVATERGPGGFSMDPANPGGEPGPTPKPKKKKAGGAYESPVKVGSIGLGAPGEPGAPNINLTMPGFEATVGKDKLAQERAADGAARRSAHRGKWDKGNFGRYKAAIENYEPTVKVGNQTALNAAQSAFATYLNTIHNRLHPIFAEEFLASLERLPQGHSFNKNLVTHLEIVVSKDEGKIVKMGVTKPSGMTAFDIVALNSMNRASPFGKAPDAIVSHDGRVYLHWEFHRDPYDACSTRNAYPYLLPAPKGGPPPIAPVPPPDSSVPSDERRGPPPLLPLAPP